MADTERELAFKVRLPFVLSCYFIGDGIQNYLFKRKSAMPDVMQFVPQPQHDSMTLGCWCHITAEMCTCGRVCRALCTLIRAEQVRNLIDCWVILPGDYIFFIITCPQMTRECMFKWVLGRWERAHQCKLGRLLSQLHS